MTTSRAVLSKATRRRRRGPGRTPKLASPPRLRTDYRRAAAPPRLRVASTPRRYLRRDLVGDELRDDGLEGVRRARGGVARRRGADRFHSLVDEDVRGEIAEAKLVDDLLCEDLDDARDVRLEQRRQARARARGGHRGLARLGAYFVFWAAKAQPFIDSDARGASYSSSWSHRAA